MKIIQDPECRRNMSTVDLDIALKRSNLARENIKDEDERMTACVAETRQDMCLVSEKLATVMTHQLQGLRMLQLVLLTSMCVLLAPG